MKVSLFVISYKKDLPFLKYLVKSYLKYASGFMEFVVACPWEDVPEVQVITYGVPNHKVFGYTEHWKGHLKHQVENDRADHYCEGDFVTHIDSDCIFTAPVKAGDLFVEGKPVMWMEKYSDIAIYSNKDDINRLYWKIACMRSTGIDPEYEYMCCFPITYPRDIYKIYRDLVEHHTGMGFEMHVLNGKHNFPYEYADFPSIGAVMHKVMPERGYWRDIRSTPNRPEWFVMEYKSRIHQFWSHGGVTPDIQEIIDAALK